MGHPVAFLPPECDFAVERNEGGFGDLSPSEVAQSPGTGSRFYWVHSDRPRRAPGGGPRPARARDHPIHPKGNPNAWNTQHGLDGFTIVS